MVYLLYANIWILWSQVSVIANHVVCRKLSVAFLSELVIINVSNKTQLKIYNIFMKHKINSNEVNSICVLKYCCQAGHCDGFPCTGALALKWD